jgi:glycosyltransferase involved in cell wall biosynthesis
MTISIITPTLNAAVTLPQTLSSVLKQSVLPIEHIIVDGLSTDKTLPVLKAYKEMAPYPVNIVYGKDNGIYDALNKGISLASGDLVGIINANDWYEEHALRDVNQLCARKGPGVFIGIQRYWLEGREFYLERVNQHFLGKKMIQHPSTFVSRAIYQQYGLFDTRYHYSADLDLIGRYLKAGVPFFHLDSIIANFRIGGVSSTASAVLESLKVRYRHGLVSK